MNITRQNVILVGIVVAMAATYGLVVYRGQSASLEDVRTQEVACRQQMEADAAKAAAVSNMAREVEAMRQQYDEHWEDRLPQRQELAEFLREISANLVAERLSNQDIEPGRPTRGPRYNQLPITIRFQGEFLALARFLGRVDEMARLTRVDQLKIGPIRDTDALAIELGMNIYFTEQ